jgi:hypothetical protein
MILDLETNAERLLGGEDVLEENFYYRYYRDAA